MPPKLRPRGARGPNLTDELIERIVLQIDAWTHPKLTWDLLITHIQKTLGVRYTRQTLDRHARISAAYQVRKKRSGGQARPATPEESRIAALEAEVARLKRENHNLLEQFNRWLYNSKRIDHKAWEEDWREHRETIRKQLDKPLPAVDRPGTKRRGESPLR